MMRATASHCVRRRIPASAAAAAAAETRNLRFHAAAFETSPTQSIFSGCHAFPNRGLAYQIRSVATFRPVTVGAGARIASNIPGSGNELSSATAAEEETEMEKRGRLERLEHEVGMNAERLVDLVVGYAELGEAVKAEEALQRMLRSPSPTTSEGVEADGGESSTGPASPGHDVYGATIDAWLRRQAVLMKGAQADGSVAKEKRRMDVLEAAERAEAALVRMEAASAAAGGDDLLPPPSPRHYEAALSAWANVCSMCGVADRATTFGTRTMGAPQRAQHLLDQMEHCRIAGGSRGGGNPATLLDAARPYRRVIESWGMSRAHQRGVRAQAIFDRMEGGKGGNGATGRSGPVVVKPDPGVYRALMLAWTKSDDKRSAFHATRVLMKMQKEHGDGTEDMAPTLDDYKVILRAWSIDKTNKASFRALSVLNKMETTYLARESDARPDEECFRHVLLALSDSPLPSMGSIVEELFVRMKSLSLVPDSSCFGAAIKTWSKSALHPKNPKSDSDAGRADRKLKQMAEMYHRTTAVIVKPTRDNFNWVIRAWSAQKNPGAAERAEELLDEMEKLYAGGDYDVRPDKDSYTFVIEAWGKSERTDKVDHAASLLRRMKDQFEWGNELAKPTVDSYHAVLNVCSNAKGTPDEKSHALQAAIQIVKTLKLAEGHEGANPMTYTLLLQCCQKLLPRGATELTRALESVFQSCCSEGLVDHVVLKTFKEAAPYELYQKVVLGTEGDAGSSSARGSKALPTEWTRNASLTGRGRGYQSKVLLSVDGTFFVPSTIKENMMTRLREKTNQKKLRGGRLQRSKCKE